MKLCWVIPDDRGGGIASVALSCCRQAARDGHDATLLMALSPSGHLDEHVDDFTLDSLEIEPQCPEAPRRLHEWLESHPQDVLFFNGCSEVEPAIPHVPQDTYALSVIHDTAPKYWHKTVEHECALDGIVAVSETVACQFRDKLDVPGNLHVCHNGTVFPPEPIVEDDRSEALLFLGGSDLQKGAEDVLELWSRLVNVGFAGELHWLGTLEESWEQKIQSLPGSERVHTLGRVPRSEVFRRAARSKALLMLSRNEPFGMATVEAMGMGCVPVAWDIATGTKEILNAGKTGLLAPLGDYDALANQVLTALGRQESIVEEIQRTARTRFSEQAMWDRYAKMLEEVTSSSPVERPRAGTCPPPYEPPTRYFQLLPPSIRNAIRSWIARSPRLNYWLQNLRGI